MFRRNKRYSARFWCCNCGKDFYLKLPVGVMPTKHGDLYYLYDVHKKLNVGMDGKLSAKQCFLFCTKCGSWEIEQVRWVAKNKV